MYKIKAILSDGGLVPESPLPKGGNIVRIICDGDYYTIYEQGDEIPELNE
ncbi:MAG: hypothetical protein AB7I27_00295 [Bacteriovoracaceae bacterium]